MVYRGFLYPRVIKGWVGVVLFALIAIQVVRLDAVHATYARMPPYWFTLTASVAISALGLLVFSGLAKGLALLCTGANHQVPHWYKYMELYVVTSLIMAPAAVVDTLTLRAWGERFNWLELWFLPGPFQHVGLDKLVQLAVFTILSITITRRAVEPSAAPAENERRFDHASLDVANRPDRPLAG